MTKVNSTKVLVIGLVCVIFAAAVIYAVAVHNEPETDDNYDVVNLYFVNAATNVLEVEKRNIPKTQKESEKVEAVFREYQNGPKSTNLAAVTTKIDIRDIVNINYPYNNSPETIAVNLTNQYNELTVGKQLLLISTLVYTFTDLDFISDVEFFTENGTPLTNSGGNTVGSLDTTDMLNNPTLVPEKVNRQNIVLYFSDGTNLVEEERSIQVKQSQTLEYQIVEQLILGPYNSELQAVIPAETKIRDIKTEEDICYVNLSGEFISKTAGDNNNNLLSVYSIVNSLTSLDNVNKVQFLIDGEKIAEIPGQPDFSKTYEKNEEIIAD